MLMDITKYLITIGLVSGIITDKISISTGITLFIIALVVFLIGFYAIPPKIGQEDK